MPPLVSPGLGEDDAAVQLSVRMKWTAAIAAVDLGAQLEDLAPDAVETP